MYYIVYSSYFVPYTLYMTFKYLYHACSLHNLQKIADLIYFMVAVVVLTLSYFVYVV